MLDNTSLFAVDRRHTLVFTPLAITRSLVVNSGEEFKLVQGHLLGLDAQLVAQLPLRRALHSNNGGIQLGASLSRNPKRVGAAGVGPHVGEGNLLGGALLQQQALVGVEEEDGKGTVKKTLVDVGHQVACTMSSRLALASGPAAPPDRRAGGAGRGERLTGLLAGTANRPIIVVQHNANLVHQTDLLLIVALQFSALVGIAAVGGGENVASQRSIDVGEESRHVIRGDLRRSRHRCSSAHFAMAWNSSGTDCDRLGFSEIKRKRGR